MIIKKLNGVSRKNAKNIDTGKVKIFLSLSLARSRTHTHALTDNNRHYASRGYSDSVRY